jgi:serine/threonine protein kinase
MSSSDSPPDLDTFLSAIVRSGLLDETQLQKAVRKLPAALQRQSDLVAELFIRNGTLSRFQAEKLLTGAERGLILGPYRILAPVGRGGMGAVYLARDSRDQRLVALKVLPPQKYREEERLLARFRREMALSQKLSHQNITRTFEAGVWQDVYYIAMEYVPGQTLKRKVLQSGPLPISQAARTFVQVTSALAHAHGQGLIHRDLKPSNIMITPNGHAKILDMGLALIEGEDLPDDKTIVGGVGYVVGTMDFIAPEQVEDPTKVDARADLYSLGCSLYFVLTGQVPFPGGSSHQKIKRHLNEWPDPVTEINPTVPAAFARLIDQLMEKEPKDRPNSAEEVRRMLLPWFGREPVLPMDVAADNANPREIYDLEVDEKPERWTWGAVRSDVFVQEKTGTGAKEPARDSAPSRLGLSTPTLLALGFGFAALLIALLAAAILLAVRRVL